MKTEHGESTFSCPTLGSKYKFQMPNEVTTDRMRLCQGEKQKYFWPITALTYGPEISSRAEKLTPV